MCGPDGLVPAIQPNALDFAHAAHWDSPYWLSPDLNPSAGLCALLREQGISNAWLDRLVVSCDARLDAKFPNGGHELLCTAKFASQHPDPARGSLLMQWIADALPTAEFFIMEAPVKGYGLTPLHFAPRPDSAFRGFFSDATIGGHLDDLFDRQQPDGGWPIHWEAPGEAAICEWRARWTLEAIATLHHYGRS